MAVVQDTWTFPDCVDQPCASCGVLLSEEQVHRLEYESIEVDDSDIDYYDIDAPYCYACAWLQDRAQVLGEFNRSLGELGDCSSADRWRVSNETLLWFYMLDGLYRDHPLSPTYFERKKTDAPVVLGLLWVRGAAHHGRLFDFHDATGSVKIAQWGAKEVHAIVTVWRTYDQPDNFVSGWKRYVATVQSRRTLDPLIEAEAFLAGLDESFWFPPGSTRNLTKTGMRV